MKKALMMGIISLVLLLTTACDKTPKYDLPDLTGMTEQEVKNEFAILPLNLTIEYEGNIQFTDGTFIRYKDYDILDSVEGGSDVVVYIAHNDGLLPDLTGLNIAQIQKLFDGLGYVDIRFSYKEDDAYEEDLFSQYVNHAVGEFVERTEKIEIELYENTITKASESLFISKYIDGDYLKHDVGIELYNPTASPIDLNDYKIAVLHNGELTPSVIIELESFILQPNETYVIVNRGASNRDLTNKADFLSDDLMFDGNDVIQLRYKNNTYIDTFYNLGNRAIIVEKEIQVRAEGTTKGNRSFNLMEWNGFVNNYYEMVGTYPVEIPDTITFVFDQFPFSYVDGGMDLVRLLSITDGDTASFEGINSGVLYSGEARVRFLGIDTPETYPVVQAWGLEAKAYTTERLENATTIYLQSSVYDGKKDNYGRTLGLVWIDGVLLNYDLVKNGYSQNYLSTKTKLVFNNRYLYQWFQDAQEYAIMHNLGIWGS
jgi:endonuclease YncB( thermonuclease family)